MKNIKLPQHMVVAVSAWSSRILSAISQLICVRLLLNGLGVERYSIFSILIGLGGWFTLVDFGVGVSLQNFISEKKANNVDYKLWVDYALLMVFLFSCLSAIAFYVFRNPLATLLLKQCSSISSNEKGILFFCTGALFIFTNLGNVIYRVWYAEYRGYLSNIAPAIAALLGLVFVYVITLMELTYYQELLLAILAYLLPGFTISIGVFINRFRHIRIVCFSKFFIIKQIAKRGSKFFLFNISAAGVLQVDYIVMAYLLCAHDIVIYNISTKIFSIILFVYSAVLSALWPMCAEYITRNQWGKIENIYRRYISIGVAYILLATIFVLIAIPYVIGFFSTNEEIVVPTSFILLLGIYNIVRIWTDTFAMILQSMNNLRAFSILVPIQAFFSISLQFFFGKIYGINGIVWGIISSYLLTVVWGLPYAFYKTRKAVCKGDFHE